MTQAVVAIIAAALGAAAKVVWDAYIQKKNAFEFELWKTRAGQLEKALSQFYWPIYLRLQRDNVVWERILERDNKNNENKRKLAAQIEGGVLLPNHLEILRIIENNVHLAGLDKEFENAIMAYVRHIDVYRSLRAIGIKDKDPISFGEPWPKSFFPALQERLFGFQREYDSMCKKHNVLASSFFEPAATAGRKKTKTRDAASKDAARSRAE